MLLATPLRSEALVLSSLQQDLISRNVVRFLTVPHGQVGQEFETRWVIRVGTF